MKKIDIKTKAIIQVLLTLENQTNLKITSQSMCNQKEHFADRFFDAEVEIWKEGKLFGKFYSRKVAYDVTTLKLVLSNSIILKGYGKKNSKLKNLKLMMLNLKNGKLNTQDGEIFI
jgi:type II secretory pathway component PulC